MRLGFPSSGRSRFPALFAFAAMAGAQALPPAQHPTPRDRNIVAQKIIAAESKGPTIPRGFALIVGISKYRDEAKSLQYADGDARLMFTELTSPEGGNFRVENVHLLVNQEATLAAIRHELEVWLPAVATEEDRVVIYFAGHGFLNNELKGFLAPYDVNPNPEQVSVTAYSMDDLGKAVGSKIRARWKVLITDACHSGAITPDASQRLNQALHNWNTSIFSLTASRDREASAESPDFGGGHGVFTYFVARGLEGAADASQDGIVTADELYDYVRREVRQVTGERQTPTADGTSYDPGMMLSFPGGKGAFPELPAPVTGSLVFEANMYDVEVYLDEKLQEKPLSRQAPTLRIEGLKPGVHTVMGVHKGYQADGPREEMVYPGLESTVTFRIRYPIPRKPAAMELVNQGLKYYLAGEASNYRKAVKVFEQALSLDPKYSEAAHYLGRAYAALLDQPKADRSFKMALAIDPDFIEARVNYAGTLLDWGRTQESVRHLSMVLERQPNHAEALSHLAQAYCILERFLDTIKYARQAIQAAPAYAEPHIWLGDGLRFTQRDSEAEDEYLRYLELSNFNPKLAAQLNYYVLGFLIGVGKRKRAAEIDIWRELRSLAFFGLCDSEKNQERFETAIQYCKIALHYTPQDALSHYALAYSYLNQARDSGNKAGLDPAIRHFQRVLELGPDLKQAESAKMYLAKILEFLRPN